ncbi:MAG: hypothetical protein U0232_01690 [Thermomicrobiales bacterium]
MLENVESAEGIQVGPGALWELPEGAKAYLLDLTGGGGVGLHLQYIDLLYRASSTISPRRRAPRSATGATSGTALEVEIQPLIQKGARRLGLRLRAAQRPSSSISSPASAASTSATCAAPPPSGPPSSPATATPVRQRNPRFYTNTACTPAAPPSPTSTEDPEQSWRSSRVSDQ